MKEGVAHQMKQEQEKQKLEIESLKAAPRAVKAANRANIISAVAILSRIILFFIQQANSNNSNTQIANLKKTINVLK